jgi:hypothetical protein
VALVDVIAGAVVASAAAPATATVRKCRRVVSMGVFVGGVLCTRVALAIGLASFVVRVRAGAED